MAKRAQILVLFKMARALLLAVTLWGWSAAAHAQRSVSLFDDSGEQIEGYEAELARLRPGDQLCFGVDCEFRFELSGESWAGSTTKIFKAQRVFEDGARSQVLALRVPLRVGMMDYALMGEEVPYVEFISEFIKGHRWLSLMGGVTLPDFFWGLKKQFVAVEFVDFDFTLSDFFLERGRFSKEILEAGEQDLYQFVDKTIHIDKIGDFRGDQIVYQHASRRWIVLDFTSRGTHLLPLVPFAPAHDMHVMGWESTLSLRARIRELSDEAEKREGQRIFAVIDDTIKRKAGRFSDRLRNLCSRALVGF